MSAGKHTATGFTIIELMLTMVVLGVMLAIGMPSLVGIMDSQRVKTAASDLHVSLTLARSESIKRNATVQVVPVSAADWSQGWSVTAGASVLLVQDAYRNVTFTGPAAAVAYVGTGRINGAAVAFFIRSANAPQVSARCVQVEPSGRPSVRMDKDGNSADGVCG